jgi:hypothetical protein
MILFIKCYPAKGFRFIIFKSLVFLNINLKKASEDLQVQKRRIYDITNVLEGKVDNFISLCLHSLFSIAQINRCL